MTASQGLDAVFDYIIVGGGTAGLVVASRLSEDSDVRVLVIEAGADQSTNPLVLTPGLVAGVYGKDEYDWNFTSVPQPNLNNRRVNQPRGKMLGGSSALNFMLMLYPSRNVMNAWGSLGNEGWDFDSLAPYFRKFATDHPPPQSAKDVVGLDYHDPTLSGNGPLQVSFGEGYNPMNAAWMGTFANLGLGVTGDPRSGKAFGAFQNPCSIDPKTKTRSYAASAYYTSEVAKRPNLVVVTEAVVKKINFDTANGDVVATGVQVVAKDGQEKTVSAKIEVVLSAGTFHTPQLLELSGVGGKQLLDTYNIPVVIDNPNVGENVQDHPIVCQSFEVNDGVPSGDGLRDGNILNAVVGQYQATREGPMGQSIISAAYTPLADANGIVSDDEKKQLFANHTDQLSSPSAKIVQSLVQSSTEPSTEYLLFPSQITISDHPKNMAEYILPSLPENYITVMTILNHPFSRGTVHITSPDYKVLPVWDPRYNSNTLDLELLARNVQFVERIVGTEPFGNLLKPGGKRLPEIKGDDLESAKDIVRQRQISVFHVSGSCAMMPREQGGVVDARLRVYGAKNLRIVDASIFPIEPLGNIQSTVYAVAEKAADIIKEDRTTGRK
ncbi:Versicolorin B synthase 2 [Colletotrichum truncatum]|uniref:Versicolorin B synthase 2 n=1 Tax=Colletotrichum truncatum TaxID=5467 RepID=A0ACC3Z900_COLTU|nr:Versicolorin B synthase 2 [Colletotrichum truncatum]KAF6780791.1 Versicolorin B synthase 2 [Colletotrichum truncatum]